jgi:hypothetical protein
LSDKNYSIDIVIFEKRIGIEVNGNQHYNSDKTLKKYYQNRKNEIENKGWNLIDVHYTNVYNEKFIDDIITYIENKESGINLDFNFLIKEEKVYKCSYCYEHIKTNSKSCVKCCKLQQRKVKDRPNLKKLLEDVKEFGYCGTGRKYGVSDVCIRKWINKTDSTSPF